MKRSFPEINELAPGQEVGASLLADIPRQTQHGINMASGGCITRFGDNMLIKVTKGETIQRGEISGITRVAHLPQISPTMSKNLYLKVVWLTYETGLEEGFDDADGDNGLWSLVFPQMRWYPEQKYAAGSGIPVSS